MKFQVSEETEPNCSQNFTQENGSFLGTTAALQTGSRRGTKSIFLSSCKRLPKTETDWEAGFGRGDGPWISSKNPEVPKTSSSGPTADPGAEPIPARRLWLNGFEFCSSGWWSVPGQSARGRRPAGTFWGLQGPRSNPGLGVLMNSKKK